MIEYVVPGNIDDRILEKGARLLAGGGLLGLPTDTSWSLACSFQSKEGLKRLRHLSGERDERHFTLLCADISQFGEFCGIDNSRFRIIKRLSPGPYVFILRTLLGTEKALGLRRREIGIRIPGHPVPLNVIKTLGQPLYAITAKRGMITGDAETPEDDLFEGGWEMEDIPGLDLILDPGEAQQRIFSTILDLTGDEIQLVRQGAGAWPV